MTIDDSSLARYCAQTPDSALTTRQRLRLGGAIIDAERQCIRHEGIADEWARLLQVRVVLHPTDPDANEPVLDAMAVIRTPRYAVRNREAPKRSTLFARLWSLLR